MNLNLIGNGKVTLIAGGGRSYTDMAAKFVRSESSIEEIIASEYDAELVRKIVVSGHKAATEFDYFLFGVEGYSRVTEVQLVRKRVASYMIKTGRIDKRGKRSFDMVLPKDTMTFNFYDEDLDKTVNAGDILRLIEKWYEHGIRQGISEGDLRYMKPQATEFKALIGMNAHALLDWFQIRTCLNAAEEIRDMAKKMLRICREVMPDIFQEAGPSCRVLGYCPEGIYQNQSCHGLIPLKKDVMALIKEHWDGR